MYLLAIWFYQTANELKVNRQYSDMSMSYLVSQKAPKQQAKWLISEKHLFILGSQIYLILSPALPILILDDSLAGQNVEDERNGWKTMRNLHFYVTDLIFCLTGIDIESA